MGAMAPYALLAMLRRAMYDDLDRIEASVETTNMSVAGLPSTVDAQDSRVARLEQRMEWLMQKGRSGGAGGGPPPAQRADSAAITAG